MASTPSGPLLCSACQRIFAPGSFELWQPRHDQNIDELQGSHVEFHSASGQERERSKAAGCWICGYLVEYCIFKGVYGSLFYTIESDGENSLLYRITFYNEEQRQESPSRKEILRMSARRCDITPSLFDTAAKSSSCVSTGQPEALQLALEWLNICQESHHCVARPMDAWYPSRLLDVSCDDSVRLVITADEQIVGDYVTLSHCWGKDPFLVMTPDNISEFKAGRSSKDFPLTFREVFAVTKYLGIRYLWIDSYCIMQGDSDSARKDWYHEAQQMCSVYANSFLNIGFSHSDGPTGGLFHERTTRYWQPLIKWQPTNDDDELIFELRHKDGFVWYWGFESIVSSLSTCAMSTRAWIVQEIVLSPRMLTFTNEQLYWQCSETHACEEFPLQTSRSIDQMQDLSAFWVMESGRQSPPSNNGSASIELRRLRSRWFQILDLYFEAKLSYPEKDLLKALDGIGQRFAQLTGQAYWCGILEGTFPQALLWKTEDSSQRNCELGTSWLAPSWHWTSEKSASYSRNEFYEPGSKLEELVLAHTFIWEDGIPFDSKTAKDATLNMQGPALICIGRLLKLTCRLGIDDGDGRILPELELNSVPSGYSFGFIDEGKLDYFKNLRPSELRYLPLLKTKDIIEGVVISIDKHGSSKRIGYARFHLGTYEDDRSSWFCKELLQKKPRLVFIE